MNDRCDSSYESRQNPAYQSTLAHFFATLVDVFARGRTTVQSQQVFNPDSAVPADAMSEEQTFRSEVNGSLPLSGHRSSVVQDEM
jgi:hypothetical protein